MRCLFWVFIGGVATVLNLNILLTRTKGFNGGKMIVHLVMMFLISILLVNLATALLHEAEIRDEGIGLVCLCALFSCLDGIVLVFIGGTLIYGGFDKFYTICINIINEDVLYVWLLLFFVAPLAGMTHTAVHFI